ncbi:MAG: SMP-30/gluconolactonase/LRE family protein [Actinomycetota bacterium]|nr:SMP-30/gluconolactonase/LRE family protein [Actinomycetota bacterium]
MEEPPASLAAEVVLDAHAEVGEGPTWDPVGQRLLWVDIPRGAIHSFDPATGNDHVVHAGQPVGAVIARQRGGLLLAARDGFAAWDGTKLTMIAPVEAKRAENRMNDGKVDPAGRFWAGTMALDSTPGAGALYRLHEDHRVESVLDGLTIPNGIDWSPDGTTMYFIDSTPGTVTAFSYDDASGAIANPKTLIEIPAEVGMPDGMTVDSAGDLWIAVWGGSAVRCYTPDGALVGHVEVPVSQVTSCAFGGPDLADLYITTASAGLSPIQRVEQPHAGALFRVRPGVAGREPHRCQA